MSTIAPHVHACRQCDPSLRPSETRESEAHFGAQFGDRRHRCVANGIEIVDGYEAMVGDDGWVLRYTRDKKGARHLCPAHGQVCAERVQGTVRVEEKVSA